MELFHKILKTAVDGGASDVHLKSGTPVVFRINRQLVPIEAPIPTEDWVNSVVDQVVPRHGKDQLAETREVDFSYYVPGIGRFRTNVFQQRGSLCLAMRYVKAEIPEFEQLGLLPIVKKIAESPRGIVLVAGATGSGKSTTLAAIIDHINHHRAQHVICLEDPIEYLHTHRKSIIEQREIYEDALSFSSALQSVFRQSPDVIMIGEMRDMETIQLALTLAETGHLILATLHTQDTTHAINRIVDVFPASHQQQIYTQLSMVLSGVIAQTLLLGADGDRRVLACEVMMVNSAIRNLIRERQLQQVYSVIQTGKAEGMMTLNDALKRLVDERRIDAETAMERSPRPKELARQLGLPFTDTSSQEPHRSSPART